MRPLSEQDFRKVADELSPRHIARIKDKLRNGENCLGLVWNDDILSWVFWSGRAQDIIDGLYELRAGEVMKSELFTSPRFRGKHFATYEGHATNRYLTGLGFLNAIVVVGKANVFSLKHLRRMEATIFGEVTYRRIFRAARRFFRLYESPIPVADVLNNGLGKLIL